MLRASLPAYTPFRAGVAGLAYNEAAFRHFLSIERRRAERSPRSILLLLVSMRTSPGRSATFTPAAASVVFSGLGEVVREVDFVGWYREGRVAAAVLTQHTAPPPDACERMASRVTRMLHGQMDMKMPLQVRVVRFRRMAGGLNRC